MLDVEEAAIVLLKEGTKGKCVAIYRFVYTYISSMRISEKLIPFLICLGEGGNMWGIEQAWGGRKAASHFELYECFFILFGFGPCEQIISLKLNTLKCKNFILYLSSC